MQSVGDNCAHHDVVQFEVIKYVTNFVDSFKYSNKLDAYLTGRLYAEDGFCMLLFYLKKCHSQFLHNNKWVSNIFFIFLMISIRAIKLTRLYYKFATTVNFRELMPFIFFWSIALAQKIEYFELFWAHI